MNSKRNYFWLEDEDGWFHRGEFEPRLWLSFAACGQEDVLFQGEEWLVWGSETHEEPVTAEQGGDDGAEVSGRHGLQAHQATCFPFCSFTGTSSMPN